MSSENSIRSMLENVLGPSDYPREWQLDSTDAAPNDFPFIFFVAVFHTIIVRTFFWPLSRHGIYIWVYAAGAIVICFYGLKGLLAERKDSRRRFMKLVRMYQHGWTHGCAFDRDFPGFGSPLVGFWGGTLSFWKSAAKSWPDYRDGKPTSIPFPAEPVKRSIVRAAKKYPCPCPGPHAH